MKKEDPKLQGLCKECTHRNSCQDAKRYLEMIGCSQYKHWRKETKKTINFVDKSHDLLKKGEI